MRMLEEVTLTLDEFEALRLADHEGLYQEAAAQQMGISRPTFSRLIAEARRKVARFMVRGTALRIEGGVVSKGNPASRTGEEESGKRADRSCDRSRRRCRRSQKTQDLRSRETDKDRCGPVRAEGDNP
jgi:predicted DNA-binding protein (UPF0251 family)